MKKLTTLQTRRQTWHNVELYATHEEAREQGFILMYDDERGTVYGIRSTDADSPHTFARVAFVPDPVNVQWYMAEAVDVDPIAEYDAHPAHIYHTTRGEFIAVYGCGMVKNITAEEVADIASGKAPAAPTAKTDAERIAYDLRTAAQREKEAAENRAQCQAIAEELEAAASGSGYKCPHCGSLYTFDEYEKTEHENEDGETLYTCPHCGEDINEYDLEAFDLYSFFSDVYNTEYRIDSNGDLNSVEIMIACGGPNIYIDTERRAVVLRWWGNSAEYPIDCADAVDDIAREWWEALRA